MAAWIRFRIFVKPTLHCFGLLWEGGSFLSLGAGGGVVPMWADRKLKVTLIFSSNKESLRFYVLSLESHTLKMFSYNDINNRKFSYNRDEMIPGILWKCPGNLPKLHPSQGVTALLEPRGPSWGSGWGYLVRGIEHLHKCLEKAAKPR